MPMSRCIGNLRFFGLGAVVIAVLNPSAFQSSSHAIQKSYLWSTSKVSMCTPKVRILEELGDVIQCNVRFLAANKPN